MAITDTEHFSALVERCNDAVDHSPGGMVTGAAALALSGCDLPRALEDEALNGPVEVSQGVARLRSASGRAHRHAKPAQPWRFTCGVPLAPPGDWLAQLAANHLPSGYYFPPTRRQSWDKLGRHGRARRLRTILGLGGLPWPLADFTVEPHRSFAGLVMAADALMRGEAAWVTKADLLGSVESLGARPGVKTARLVVALAEPGTDSNPETWVRPVLRDCGLPRGMVNRPVKDGSGKIVRYEDLGLEHYPAGIEYQGRYHFESVDQFYADMERREQLRCLGHAMIEVGAKDLRDQHRLVRRVATELARIEGVKLPPPT
ncbi:MAG: hypothetical protein LBC97_07450 [Bifidobacteriaceae bacterium]|nr:hypothetical protein [Bifidobacteriaceae bacterium]